MTSLNEGKIVRPSILIVILFIFKALDRNNNKTTDPKTVTSFMYDPKL
jgi:hypothetical protein